MKKIIIAISMIVAALPVGAGISSGLGSSSPVVMVAMPEPRMVSVFLAMPADFVSVPVRVYSEQKNTALAYDESRQAIDLIVKRAKDKELRTSMGIVSLSQRKGGFGISGGSWSLPAASTDVYLLVPLSKNRTNIFGAGADAARFVESLNLPGKTKCELGKLQLAVENPEQYRAKLLGLIAEEIKRTRETMTTAGNVKVDGLESSVTVRQADNSNVELFLNYSLSLTIEK